MRIFIFATDDKGLTAFQNKKAAIEYCEETNIQDGEWLF